MPLDVFEADLPPEIYAYRPGRNAQQAVVEVEELVFWLADLPET
jgi:RNA-directed DNA polymerase